MATALSRVAAPADGANAAILTRYWGMAVGGAGVDCCSGWWFIVDVWVIVGLMV